VRHGGFTHFDQGRSAVVQTDRGLTVLLTSRRVPPWSLRQLTSCQLDPSSFQVIVAKGVVAPLAAYRDICRSVIQVDTPGCTCANMQRLRYLHRRRPMFPFEEVGDGE
jgi:microcystin degradation protein MlrC